MLLFVIGMVYLNSSGQQPIPKDDSLFYFNPYLDWGTYFSGSSWLLHTQGIGCVSDNNYNFYFAGYTESLNNIATPGAFKEQITGEEDGFIQKFDANGERIWGTYFGGEGIDQVYDMIMDLEGNILIAGYTSSYDSIATPGTHQPVLTGGSAGFLTKFTPQGTRIWGTYLSGDVGGWIGRICVDSRNNILVCGNTRASSGFSTPGCHQPEFGGSFYGDGFLAKFNPDGTIQFCTYYGGSEMDETWGVNVDKQDNIYLMGVTTSPNNISTPGTQQPYHVFAQDCFVAKFTPSGIRKWGTYLGGISTDQPQDVRTDPEGNCVVVGSTSSMDHFATPGAHKEDIQDHDGFIVKYDSAGMRMWGTYFGGWANDGIVDCIKTYDNSLLIVAGSTNSHSGIATSGAYQPNWYENYNGQGNGYNDGFLAAFDFDGNQVWGTYLGANLHDQVSGISCDSLKNLSYIGSTTSVSAEYLTTPGCFQAAPESMHATFFGRMIIDTLITQINETSSRGLVVYPNPCRTFFEILADKNFSGIQLFNPMNKEVMKHSFAPTRRYRINCKNLNAGIYLVKISFGEVETQRKVIKL